MAYGYNTNQQTNPTYTQNQMSTGQIPIPNQTIQPLFPQPQGNVYNINSTLEVANVPVGAGVSVALCMPENVMFIKTMQNGNPLFYPYKIVPFNQEGNQETETQQPDMAAQIKDCCERIENLEKALKKKKGDDFNI